MQQDQLSLLNSVYSPSIFNTMSDSGLIAFLVDRAAAGTRVPDGYPGNKLSG